MPVTDKVLARRDFNQRLLQGFRWKPNETVGGIVQFLDQNDPASDCNRAEQKRDHCRRIWRREESKAGKNDR
jgi:hypothetical protein